MRAALALVLMGLTFAAGMASASAHAVVTSSKPADGEQLKTAPADVTITFSEDVSSDLGGLKVLDAAGNRVDKNDSSQPTPSSLRASLVPGLSDGTFVANYKVVSADGHAVSGAIVFAVGNAKIGDVSGLEAKNDPSMEVLSRVGQFLTYLGALLAAGLAFFLAFVHDGAPDRMRLQSITRWSTIVAAAGIFVTIVAQAALATGGGLGSAFQSGTLAPVLRQGLGWSAAVLLVGLAAVHLSVDMPQRVVEQSLAFYGGLAVTGSFVLWGHASEAERSWLAIPADVVHVACAAAWFGGLVGLLFVLRARRPATAPSARAGTPEDACAPAAGVVSVPTEVAAPGGLDAAADRAAGGVALLERDESRRDDAAPDAGAGTDDGASAEGGSGADGGHDEPRPRWTSGVGAAAHDPAPGSFPATVHTVLRFSDLAAVTVILLVLAGTALAWTELGSFSALLTTTYGLTLTVKLALVAAVLFMAGYNRWFLLPWLLPAEDELDTPADAEDAGDAPERSAPADVAMDLTATSAPSASASAPDVTPPDPGADAPGPAPRDLAADAPPVALSTATSDAEDRGAHASASAAAADHTADGWRTLVRTLLVEALGIVAVLAVTAVLVNVTPGASTEVKGPYQASKAFRDGNVFMTIAPNQPGVNNIHLDFTGADGRASDAAQKVTLELTQPAKDIGPITREFVKAGTGHFILENINDLSIPGDWQVTLLVRVSDFDQERVEFQDTVT